MEPEPSLPEHAQLAAAARLPGRPRVRLGVGAAVVLLIVALVAAVVISAVGQQVNRRILAPAGAGGTGSASSAEEESGPSGGSPGAIIFVHVLGQVARPGLFELNEGSRVIDAVAAAGGLAETADPAGVNLARRVSDGEQLYIPRIGEVPPPLAPVVPGGGGPGAPGLPGALLSLSTATAAELDTLPRIGPAMAQRIIDYRDANGPFASVDDLLNVTGIGEKTFDALKDLVSP